MARPTLNQNQISPSNVGWETEPLEKVCWASGTQGISGSPRLSPSLCTQSWATSPAPTAAVSCSDVFCAGRKAPGPRPWDSAPPPPLGSRRASRFSPPPHSRLPSRCPRLPRGRRAAGGGGGGGRSGLNRGSPDLARWDVTNRRRPTLRAEQSRRPPEPESAAGEPGADQPQTQSCPGTVRDAGLGRGVSQA